MRKLTENDFWSKKKIDQNGCWIFTGCIGTNGYGQLFFQGKHYLAHQLAYRLTYGEIPKGKYVLHKGACYNKRCFNPNHLYLGTHLENLADARMYGKYKNSKKAIERINCVDKFNQCRCEITEMRELLNNGMTMTDIAKVFDLSLSSVSYILKGKRRTRNVLKPPKKIPTDEIIERRLRFNHYKA